MTDIGKGDWVECVNDGSAVEGFSPLSVGSVYRVEELVFEIYPGGVVGYGVTLADVPVPPGCDPGFWVGLFRPVYRPKPSLIESLKVPAPSLEEVVA